MHRQDSWVMVCICSLSGRSYITSPSISHCSRVDQSTMIQLYVFFDPIIQSYHTFRRSGFSILLALHNKLTDLLTVHSSLTSTGQIFYSRNIEKTTVFQHLGISYPKSSLPATRLEGLYFSLTSYDISLLHDRPYLSVVYFQHLLNSSPGDGLVSQ